LSYLVNLTLAGRHALVVGAGKVASRKVGDLLEAGAQVTVVAPAVSDEIRALAGAGRIALHERTYSGGDLRGAFLAVAATGSEEVNAQVSKDAQAAGILVNVVDRPALCTFTLPAVVRRGDLTLAVATDGRCPAYSAALRRELEARYGDEFAQALDLLSELRREMIARQWSSARISEAISGIYGSGLIELIRTRRFDEVERLVRRQAGEDIPLPGRKQD
jgi:precorrin-2 dehydrogenase/sirohydrochlorin ferrochelatase